MATIKARKRADGRLSYRVVWRAGGGRDGHGSPRRSGSVAMLSASAVTWTTPGSAGLPAGSRARGIGRTRRWRRRTRRSWTSGRLTSGT